MTEEEQESFFLGAECWDALLNEPDPLESEDSRRAKRYAACLMLHTFYSIAASDPRRALEHTKALISALVPTR